MVGFSRYVLRTTDLLRARSFYERVCGAPFVEALARGTLRVEPLPPGAVASGAPPHWIPFVGVADVDAARARLALRGATPLGVQSSVSSVLRDPWGAPIGLFAEGERALSAASDVVGWHHLNTSELEPALAFYREAFGWTPTARHVRPGPLGDPQPFVSLAQGGEGGAASASVSPSVALPFVHPYWWTFFRVADHVQATSEVTAAGGRAEGAVRTAHGDWVVPCEDDLGGGFGLVSRA